MISSHVIRRTGGGFSLSSLAPLCVYMPLLVPSIARAWGVTYISRYLGTTLEVVH